MYKAFIDTLERAGVELPSWAFVLFLIIIGVIGLYLFFKTYAGPAIHKLVDMYTDISSIKELKEMQLKAIEKSIATDNKIENELFAFVDEMRAEVKTFTDNRLHDRAQSFEIQKELTDSIKTITEGQEFRDKQIEALMCGSKELLGDRIDQRYSKYIALSGIPENEVDEFDSIYDAYRGLNGNHGRETKYNYVKEHLPVIPVETHLIQHK